MSDQPPSIPPPVARDLISRMLDPNSETRATVREILAHPWLQARRTSLVTPTSAAGTKTRKSNVRYSSSEALQIRNTLIKINCDCDCSCHHTLKHRRDSAFTKHCSDCEEILANDLAKTHGLSRNSSGYGSENGSMLFTPRVSLVDCDTLTIDTERRSSHLHRSSFSKSPIPPVPQILEMDDEEVVFV